MSRFKVDVTSRDFGRAVYVRVLDTDFNKLIVGTFDVVEPAQATAFDKAGSPADTAFIGYEPATLDAYELFESIIDAIGLWQLQNAARPLALDPEDAQAATGRVTRATGL